MNRHIVLVRLVVNHFRSILDTAQSIKFDTANIRRLNDSRFDKIDRFLLDLVKGSHSNVTYKHFFPLRKFKFNSY